MIMKKLRKVFRILRLVFLIVLACTGIGLAGGVPLQTTHKKEAAETTIECVLTDKEENGFEQPEIKQ